MVSDPFAPHPSENLEASTAIPPVTAQIMDHAGQQAARLVETAAGTHKLGRKSKRAQATRRIAAPVEPEVTPAGETAPSETAIVEAVHAPVGVVPPGPWPVTDVVQTAIETNVSMGEPVVQHMTEDAIEGDPAVDVGAEAERTGERQPEAPIESAAVIDAPIDDEETARDIAPEPEAASKPMVITAPEIETAADAVQVARHEIETVSTEGDAPLAPDHDDVTAFHAKISEVFYTNLDASLSFWLSLMKVRSASEAVELNTRHLRQQIETFLSQNRDLSALGRQAATAAMTSLAGSFRRLPD